MRIDTVVELGRHREHMHKDIKGYQKGVQQLVGAA